MSLSLWAHLGCLLVTAFVVCGLELTLEADELIKAQRESAGKFFYYDSNAETLMLNRSLFVYRQDNYEDWSFWSPCSPHTCLEHRYKRCKDDSYNETIYYPSTNRKICPFKYLVEERPCEDKSKCLINAEPSQELERMDAICGTRDSFEEDSKKKNSRRRYRDEENYEEDYLDRWDRRARRRHELKIFGGKSAKSMSWPWNVGLYKAASYNASEGLTRLRSENIMCGGTLITPRWVLTAAHCLKPILGSTAGMHQGVPVDLNANNMGPISMLVRVGDSVLEGTRDKNEQESDHVVDKAIIHPEWVPQRLNSPYDIALLRLATPVDIENSGIKVACLPKEQDSQPPEDALCYTVGWGENEEPSRPRPYWDFDAFWPFAAGRWKPRQRRPDTLKEIRVDIEPLDRCFREIDEESDVQICAGSQERGVCAGDTGGGLFCRNESNGKWYIYGVMGSGPTRRCKYNRWVYNSVESVSQWINRYAV